MSELLVFARYLDRVVPVGVESGGTVGDLVKAVEVATDTQRIRLRAGGEELRWDDLLADTGLCFQAVVDVIGRTEIPFESLIAERRLGEQGNECITVEQVLEQQSGKRYALKRSKRYARKHAAYDGTLLCEREISELVEVGQQWFDMQSRWDHPNVLTCEEAYFRDGHMYLLMEYMGYGSLSVALERETKVPEPELSDIMFQVCMGLDFLHNKSISHKDLKPSNILASYRGEIKICDFDLPYPFKLLWNEWQPDQALNHRSYLAPERVRGETYSKPADIWSLGLCVAEMALGRFPWEGQTMFELVDMLAMGRAEVDWSSTPVSPELKDFVDKCMTQDPQRRATTRDLLAHKFITQHRGQPDRLRRWLAKLPGDSTSP